MSANPPIRLKPADSPVSPDPQESSISLLADLRALVDELLHVRTVCTRGGVISGARSVELYELAARALDEAEALSMSCRFHGVYSADYGV